MSRHPFIRPARTVTAAAVTAALLSACGSGGPDASSGTRDLGDTEGSTTYPLTITDNCGVDVTIEKVPERVVSVNQGSTEILLSLGLADRMVGTSTWTDDIRPNLADANAAVPRLGDDAVSFERVLDEEPDLVTASFEGALNDEDPDRRAQYARLGVPTYLAPSHCDGRTDTSGDGPRDHPLTMDVVYDEITQLAEIFDVPSRGAALVADLRTRMAAAASTAAATGSSKDGVTIAYWFANTELPYMAGANGAPGVMSSTVGARNVFDDTIVEWPQISWESVLDRDPDVIALGDLQRDSQSGDRLADKMRFLETNPVTRRLTAVREKRYVVLDGADMNPSIRTVDGTEKVAKALADLGLAR